MSRNTGAVGNIIIPEKVYAKLSKSLTDQYMEMQKKDFDIFNSFIEKMLLKYKGKRNLNWNDIMNNESYMFYLHNVNGNNRKSPFLSCSVYDLAFKCINYNDKSEKPKLLKQKKVVTGKITEFCFDENFVILNKEKKSLQIRISYNNHSVEQAMENDFFKFVLGSLKNIEWTKNTGGEILVTQEEDENYGEHTSSYIMCHFGVV